MNYSNKVIRAPLLALLLTGCSQYQNLESDFGNSARNLIEAQTYDRNAALNPDPEAPNRLDGQYGESVLPVYRGDVGDPKAIQENVTVDIFSE